MATDGAEPVYRMVNPEPDGFETAAVALLDGEEWQEPRLPPGTIDLDGPDVRAIARYDDTVGAVDVLWDSTSGAPLAGSAGRRFIGPLEDAPRPVFAHSGARSGAGRKLLQGEPMVRRTVTLPAAVVTELERAGEGNLSAGIRHLVARQQAS